MKLECISGKNYLACTRPVVYTWMRGREYLYIGCSTHGLCRVFDRNHHILRKQEVLPNDKITMKFFDNTKKMRSTESNLIKRYQPRYNLLPTQRNAITRIFIRT